MKDPLWERELEASTAMQNTFAIGMGASLIILGIIRALFHGALLGVLPQSYLHAMLYLIGGGIFLWAGISHRAVAQQFNRYLGIFFLIVGGIEFVLVLTGTYSLIPDMILNTAIGALSVSFGNKDPSREHKGEGFQEALGYPYGK